jgi:hypothetical protein
MVIFGSNLGGPNQVGPIPVSPVSFAIKMAVEFVFFIPVSIPLPALLSPYGRDEMLQNGK